MTAKRAVRAMRILTLLSCSVWACASAPPRRQASDGPQMPAFRMQLTPAPFEVLGAPAEVSLSGKVIAGLVSGHLARLAPGITLLEPESDIAVLTDEMRLQASGLVDSEQVLPVNRFRGANTILSGVATVQGDELEIIAKISSLVERVQLVSASVHAPLRDRHQLQEELARQLLERLRALPNGAP